MWRKVNPHTLLVGMLIGTVSMDNSVRYSLGRGRKRKDNLNRTRLPLFRQRGATVGLTTRLSAVRDQGGSIFVRRLVEAIVSEWSELTQSCPTLCDPWTVAHQALPSMGFSRQEYWSGLPFIRETLIGGMFWVFFSWDGICSWAGGDKSSGQV